MTEWIYPDDYWIPGDTDDRASFERAIADLVSINGRAGGVIRLSKGKTYYLPGSVALKSGIVVLGHEETLPNTPRPPENGYSIINTTSLPTFTYVPEASLDDRLSCPCVIGVRMQADNCIDFGYDDNDVSYFMSNGIIRNCWMEPYSEAAGNVPGGGTAIRMIENYRGGVEGCWIVGYKTGIIQKSGDLCAIRRNRVAQCTVNIAVVSPASTGTQTIIEHNDLLDAYGVWEHPEFGGAYVIYSEDRWPLIQNNYFESSKTDGLCKNALIKIRNSAAAGSIGEVQTAIIQGNRLDYNSGQATYAMDFSEATPLTLDVGENYSNKGPTILTAVNWPGKYKFTVDQGSSARRRINWRQTLTWAPPPFTTRSGGSELVLDAGTMVHLAGAQGWRMYADSAFPDSICFDYDKDASAADGGPGSEYFLRLPSAYVSQALDWDFEIDYSASINSVEFGLQVRNDAVGYVDQNDLTCTTSRQTFRRFRVQRTNMTFLLVGKGAVSGAVRIHSIRIRPSNTQSAISAPTGGTADTEARTAINQIRAALTAAGVTL